MPTQCLIIHTVYIFYKYDMHLPTHIVRYNLNEIHSSTQLFHGLVVLRDGWPGCHLAKTVLEASHALIFTGFFVLHQKGAEVCMGRWVV